MVVEETKKRGTLGEQILEEQRKRFEKKFGASSTNRLDAKKRA
jgi:hypothetical protein